MQIEKHKKTFFNRFLWSKEIICVIIIYRVFSYIHIILIGVKIMTPEEKSILVKSQKLSRWNAQKIYYNTGKKTQRTWTVKRGEVYFADLGENIGSEENKIRPVVVLQSNAYNFRSPVFTVAIISSSILTIPDIQVPIVDRYPFTDENGIAKDLCGTIDLGQIKTIGKERIVSRKICKLSKEMKDVDIKLLNVLGLSGIINKKNNIIQSLSGKIEFLKKELKQF